MPLNSHYVKQAMDAMIGVAPVTCRRIFNGIGIYHLGVQFAIILQDKLYFRANEDSRCLFEANQMEAFQPRCADKIESYFFQLPDDVLNKPEELKYWMRISVEAAHQGEFLDDESNIDLAIRHNRQAAL
jgi:DNA transformation protein and related proteins